MNPLNLKSRLLYGKERPLIKEPDPGRYLDPDEPLAGRCMTCKTVMSCLRSEAVSNAPKYGQVFPEPGVWPDLLRAECPKCGAAVFVMNAKEFKAVLDKEAKDG